ncbi:U32 family peptidase [Thalassobius vesicularis]|uniref:Ubiquinone biosynthesis protein UbiV n=1 Tax=Thalassobius vesicularis TaxID=1294297 RepID=A0A4S3MAT6_9RHOB|nr:U32 family peptidase [Thalassobius vesicularis]THD73980.1 U32 family peptidase [Thalassobius vesicularis]
MELTVGPIQYFWSEDNWADFYTRLADSPVDRVVVGELVCSKRLPFFQHRIPEALAALQAAGKQVAVTSLALVTLKRERKQTAELAEMGMEVEVNDLTALAYLPQGAAFSVGPLVNVYSAGTLEWLARRGATRISLPPELPIASVQALVRAARDNGVMIEVWGHGRLPLAISGRCYHARMHGRPKDNCLFACEDDPDGADVRTLDDTPFLAINGVQTLSDTHACAAYQLDLLQEAGVGALRLSPQSQGFDEVCAAYRGALDGAITDTALEARLRAASPAGTRLSDGFLTGETGVAWSRG